MPIIESLTKSRVRRCATLLTLLMLLSVSCRRQMLTAQNLSAANVTPIAVDSIDTTNLIVFDSTKRVSEVYLDQPSHPSRLLFTVADEEVPIDMTLGQYKKQLYIFVLTQSAKTKQGLIRAYTYPQGKPTGAVWSLDDVATGMDYDEISGVLYFATRSNRLFRIPQCSGRIELVGLVPGPDRVGPLGVLPGLAATDCASVQDSRTKIYMGDVLSGGVYEYDLHQKSIDKVSQYIGSVSATLVNRANRGKPLLLAADASRHVIVPFAIQSNGSLVAKPTVGEGFLKTPSSMSMMRTVNVVADIDRHALVVFSTNWQHLYDIVAKQVSPSQSPW